MTPRATTTTTTTTIALFRIHILVLAVVVQDFVCVCLCVIRPEVRTSLLPFDGTTTGRADVSRESTILSIIRDLVLDHEKTNKSVHHLHCFQVSSSILLLILLFITGIQKASFFAVHFYARGVYDIQWNEPILWVYLVTTRTLFSFLCVRLVVELPFSLPPGSAKRCGSPKRRRSESASGWGRTKR